MRTSILFLSLVMISGRPGTAAPKLLGYWDFNLITDNCVSDLSGSGRHGRIHGNPESVAGVTGAALRFKSNDDYVDFGAPVVPARDFTISVWLKCDDVAKQFFLGQYRYGDGRRLDLAVREGSVRIQIDQIIDSPKIIAPGKWFHLVYTRADGKLKIYVNGDRVTETDLPGEVTQSENLIIGKIVVPKQDSYRFTGSIDEVKIWDSALSAREIREQHRSVLTAPAAAPNP